MPATAVPTRDRILYSAAELFRRQGYAGTGLKQVSGAAQAPFGSIYHFFPGGKEELGEAVIRAGGAFFLELLKVVLDAEEDLVSGIGAFFAGAADTVRETGYADACPIATLALELASTSEPLRIATHDAFESWLTELTARFTTAGVADPRALAINVLSLIEGAFVLARAGQSVEALEVTGAAAVALVRTALPA